MLHFLGVEEAHYLPAILFVALGGGRGRTIEKVGLGCWGYQFVLLGERGQGHIHSH